MPLLSAQSLALRSMEVNEQLLILVPSVPLVCSSAHSITLSHPGKTHRTNLHRGWETLPQDCEEIDVYWAPLRSEDFCSESSVSYFIFKMSLLLFEKLIQAHGKKSNSMKDRHWNSALPMTPRSFPQEKSCFFFFLCVLPGSIPDMGHMYIIVGSACVCISPLFLQMQKVASILIFPSLTLFILSCMLLYVHREKDLIIFDGYIILVICEKNGTIWGLIREAGLLWVTKN